MTNKPLVSILTPTYNMGKYLEECIQSVLNQDYPYVEQIIQDANSTDESINILRRYRSSKYKNKIKIFREPDKGQSDGLNKALQKTSGDILLVLNADDALLPHACSWAVANMKKYPEAGVIYGQQYLVDASGKIFGIGVTGEFDYVRFLCIEQYMTTQAAFIRRQALEKVGFWTDTTLETMPDYEMWLRIASKNTLKEVKGIMTRYRIWNRSEEKHIKKARSLIKAKSVVLEKILNSPDSPLKIKNLRKRAYAGMYLWVSEEMLIENNFNDYFLYSLKALLTNPSRRVVSRICKLFKEKFIIKFLHYDR